MQVWLIIYIFKEKLQKKNIEKVYKNLYKADCII